VKLRLAVVAAVLLAAAPAFGSAPSVQGRAWYVESPTTGEVLTAQSPTDRVPIASITKLMTVLVTLDHAKLGDVVTIGRAATKVGESSIFLRVGEQLTVGELIEAALIQSANDAAYALAEHVGGGDVTAFVALMNEKAAALGLKDTHFVNPDGLDTPDHYSSARDVTKLAEVAMHKQVIRDIVRQTAAKISGGRTLHTWNDLLYSFPHLLGVKTGHTSAAGWSEVAAARADGVTVFATLLGEASRAQRNSDLAALLAWGLSRYRVVPVVQRGRIYAWARAPYGRHALALVAPNEALRLVRIDRLLSERVVVKAVVSLPIARGTRLGEVQVFYGKKLLATEPLVASRTIEKPDFWGRVGWYGRRALHHVASWFS
jgi:D-alanyl-D-alanine carboxypeptidase